MEKKKATGSYNRKSNPKTNLFTMEEKKATGSYNRKRLLKDPLFHNVGEKGDW